MKTSRKCNGFHFISSGSFLTDPARWSGYALTQASLAFRGIQKTLPYTVVAEEHDLSRFVHLRHFMAWLGLVPGEHSSGATRRHGTITRCGNRFARSLLAEAA